MEGIYSFIVVLMVLDSSDSPLSSFRLFIAITLLLELVIDLFNFVNSSYMSTKYLRYFTITRPLPFPLRPLQADCDGNFISRVSNFVNASSMNIEAF